MTRETENHAAIASPPVPPARSRWQFSLRTILLIMAVVGVWTAVLINRREIPLLTQRIKLMRPLARELVVKDEDKIAVVKCEETWYDENEWLIYLPSDRYQLSLATQQIDQNQTVPDPAKSVRLPAGQFRLALMQEKHNGGWRVRVTKDGQDLLTIDEPKEWYPSTGSVGGGHYSTTEQIGPPEHVVLFHRRFTRQVTIGPGTTSSQVPKEPSEGVALWIDPLEKAK